MEHFPGRQSRPATSRQPEPARQQPVSQQQYQQQPTQDKPHTSPKRTPKKSKLSIIIGAVLLLALLGMLAYAYTRGSTVPGVDAKKHQAVFLTNGQVYFGKLSAAGGGYYKLNDIFYLQANGTEQDSENPQGASSDQNANVQLIKLGNEVHGPEDEMVIGKEQVLFFENLKTDGKVSKTIADYSNNKK